MNELARMQYLTAMGIDTYVPRSILPAAKLSVACALPEVWLDEDCDEIIAAIPSVNSAVNSAKPFEANSVNQSLVQAILAPSQALTEIPLARPSTDRTLQQLFVKTHHKPLRFSLSIWQLANGVMIIDSREPKAALPTSALLHNIVAAFAQGITIPKSDQINWPLLHSDVVNPNEMQEAQEMTQAFLASRFEISAPKALVVMGEAAATMVLGLKDIKVEGGGYGTTTTPPHLPCPTIYLPSLAQLLKEPLLKRYIWAALKPWF